MTTTTVQPPATTSVEIPTPVVEMMRAAIAARDEGIAQAEDADRSGWNKALIDQAIDAFATVGRPFSANDLRHVLPDDVPGPLMGARFLHASKGRDVIRFAGYVHSTKESTHYHPIKQWIGTQVEVQD